ncbi:MAG: fused MFS/spermidine synthase [Chloroflexota bacterium]
MNSNRYLYITVFASGMSILGVELSASRLLDPFFGNSLIIWANLIGLVLLYLSVGYALGGRWADKDPRPSTFFQIIAWGAFLSGLVPVVSRPILSLSVSGFAAYSGGVLLGSLLAVLLLLSVPLTLLAMASPFAIRLAVTDVDRAGQTAGAIYAWSTIGSILGTFLPVLVLIPNIGTRLTFMVFSITLQVIAIGGLYTSARAKAGLHSALLIITLLLAFFTTAGPIRADEGTIFETESQYNYIQVIQKESDIILKLNEGQGIHSVYNSELQIVGGIWDYFLVAPYFNNVPYLADDLKSVLIIGAAAGTVSKELTLVHGPIPIDGVEIDPAISQVGRDFFEMNEPNLTTINQDGRYYLANANKTYDMIAVDAYRPPYIPFQLTTVEFFQEVSDHLTDDGIVAINAGRLAQDYSLVTALGSTMKVVFPNVYILDTPDYGSDFGNSLIIGTKSATLDTNFTNNIALNPHPLIQYVAERSLSSRIFEITCTPGQAYSPIIGDLPVAIETDCITTFTDDKAPVEQVLHGLIIRYLLGL